MDMPVKVFVVSLFIMALTSTDCCAKVDAKAKRNSDYPVDAQFLRRQSKYNLARAMSNEQMRSELMILFEAARWSASCFNNQPWRFIYALHGTKEWDTLNSIISPRNQQWVKNAGALVLVLSSTSYERNGKPAPTHSFDAGLAVSNFLLQASNNGLAAHPMEMHDYDKARKVLSIGKEYTIEAMIAVGEESTQSSNEYGTRDLQVSDRKPLSEIVFEGSLPGVKHAKKSPRTKAPAKESCCD
jgi:nitroreductase